MGAGDTWPRGAVTEGALALYSTFPLCPPPTPRNQKCFPNPKRPREWGLVKKLLMHQDRYVYSVFDALSLGETNCTLERAMERWTQPSTTCQNCIKQAHCQFHTKKDFFKKVHASIHVKTMQLDHSPSKETIGKWRTSKPAPRQPTSCPKWAPLFQSSCWKKAGERNSEPEVPPRPGRWWFYWNTV